jgi:hypothetical protein
MRVELKLRSIFFTSSSKDSVLTDVFGEKSEAFSADDESC